MKDHKHYYETRGSCGDSWNAALLAAFAAAEPPMAGPQLDDVLLLKKSQYMDAAPVLQQTTVAPRVV